MNQDDYSDFSALLDKCVYENDEVSLKKLERQFVPALLKMSRKAKLPERHRSPDDFNTELLLNAAVILEDEPAFKKVATLIAQEESDAYEIQRNDPHISRRDMGSIVSTSRLLGFALQSYSDNERFIRKAKKVISLSQRKSIDHEMISYSSGGKGKCFHGWSKQPQKNV